MAKYRVTSPTGKKYKVDTDKYSPEIDAWLKENINTEQYNFLKGKVKPPRRSRGVSGTFEAPTEKEMAEIKLREKETPLFSRNWPEALKERGLEIKKPTMGVGGAVDRMLTSMTEGTLEYGIGAAEIATLLFPPKQKAAAQKWLTDERDKIHKLAEESYEATGGRDIYSGIGHLIPDLVALTQFDKLVTRAAPFLMRKSKDVLKKKLLVAAKKGATKTEFAKIITGHAAPEAIKGMVRGTTIGAGVATLKGKSKEEIIQEAIAFGGIEALLPILGAGTIALKDVPAGSRKAVAELLKKAVEKLPFKPKGKKRPVEAPRTAQAQREMVEDMQSVEVINRQIKKIDGLLAKEPITKPKAETVPEAPPVETKGEMSRLFTESVKAKKGRKEILEDAVRAEKIRGIIEEQKGFMKSAPAQTKFMYEKIISRLEKRLMEMGAKWGVPPTKEALRKRGSELAKISKDATEKINAIRKKRPTPVKEAPREEVVTEGQEVLERRRNILQNKLDKMEEKWGVKPTEEALAKRRETIAKGDVPSEKLMKAPEKGLEDIPIHTELDRSKFRSATKLFEKGGLKSVSDWVIHNFSSNLARLKLVGKDAYESAKLLAGTTRKTESILKNGFIAERGVDKAGNVIVKKRDMRSVWENVINPIRGQKTTSETFIQRGEEEVPDIASKYLQAKHSMEAIAKDPKYDPGVSYDMAKSYVDSVEKILKVEDSAAYDAIKVTEGRFREWANFLLDYLEKQEFIGPKDKARILAKWSEYVPLKRYFSEAEMEQMSKAAGGPTALRKRSAEGAEREVYNVFETMLDNYYHAIAQADRNKFVKDTIMRIVEDIRTNPQSIWKGKVNIKEAFSTGMERVTEIGEEGIAKIAAQQRALGKNEIMVRTLKDGNVVFTPVEILDPMLLDAMKKPSSSWHLMPRFLDSMLTWSKNKFQTFTTSLPGFALYKNPARDFRTMLQHDPTVAAEPWKFAPQSFKALRGMYKSYLETVGLGDLFDILIQEGAGGSGFWEGMARKQFKEFAKQGLHTTEPKIIGTFKKAGKAVVSPFRTMEDVGRIIEQMPRYNAAERNIQKMLDDGVPLDEALKKGAVMYRDITADFSEMGMAARYIGRYTPFFTSQLAGTRQFFRAAQKNPAGFMWKGFSYSFLPSFYVWWKNKDEKWYQAMDDTQKNMWLPVTKHFWLPKAFDLDALFSTVPLSVIDSAYRKRPGAIKRALKPIMDLIIPSDAFLTGSGNPYYSIAYGWKTGKTPYWGTPIVAPWLDRPEVPSEAKKGPYTSQIGIELGKMLDVSPAKLDFVVNQMMSSTGRHMLKLGDVGVAAIKKAMGDRIVKPKVEPWDMPEVRNVYHPDYMYRSNTTFMNDLYEIRTRAERVRYRVDEEGVSEDGLSKKDKRLYGISGTVEEAWQSTRENRQEMLKIVDPSNTDYTPQEKRDELNRLAYENNITAKEVLESIK